RPDAIADAASAFDTLTYVRSLASRAPEAAFLPSTRSARDAACRVAAAIERNGRLVSGRLRGIESAAAALGLGLRTPYLDHRLCDWMDAATSPRSGVHLLSEVLAANVPPPLRKRVSPTSVPLAVWLRGDLRPVVEQYLLADDPEGFFA